MNTTAYGEGSEAEVRGTEAGSVLAARWRRWAALGGVLFVVLLVIGLVLAGDQPGADSSTVAINSFYSDTGKRGAALAQAYLVGLGAVALLGFLATLRSALRRAEGEPASLSALAFGSGLAMLVLLLMAIALRAAVPAAFGFSDQFKTGRLDPQLVRLLDAPAYWLFVYASLAGAVMIAATAAVARRTSVPARWLGRYGYVAAALALTSLVFPGGFAVPLLWIVAVSVCLARRGGPASGLRRPLAGAGLVVVVATSAAAGCGGSGSANFTKADLAGIVLKPSEGPEGLVYWKEQSGPNMLEKEGKQSAQGLKILRGLGFAGDYGSQFVAPRRSAPVQYAESFGIVLGDEKDASKALAIFKNRQRREGQRIEAIAADGLGEESWGMRSVFFPGAPPTYFYAWRVGNAMFALALAGKPDTVSEDDARALADQVDARAGD